jgi:type I restriction-modification system DNA methylase subunit
MTANVSELAPPNFAERLRRYLQDIAKAGSEAGRAFLFLEFIRDIFKQADIQYLEKLYPELEKYIKLKSRTLVVRGRPDAFLGNLIIEFKEKLVSPSLDDAESELKRYVAILWSKQSKSRTPYLTMATDGERFKVYRPRTTVSEGELVVPEAVVLDEIDALDLKGAKPGDAFVWFDRYVLYKVLRPATAESFSREFGLDKPVFKDAAGLLREAWKHVRETTLYDQWAMFLRVVYGSNVESEELFIRHAYLATLAKLLAYSSFSGGALPVFDEQIAEILEGRIFSEKWGIHNFLEEDFFSWVARDAMGLKAARIILERLATYDLSTVDEDILKALYQDLVDPEARHDLGEYYTPDWLAEYIIEQAMTDPAESVIDPACGSGTFLAAAIRKKKRGLNKKLSKEELLNHILATVKGMDVHPLAVILSRTTYLISLGTELLNSRKGPIAIPVYMADSIRLPEEDTEIYYQMEVYRKEADGLYLRIPRKIAEEPALADPSIEIIKEYANMIAKGEEAEEETFHTMLFQRIPALAEIDRSRAIAKVLYETSKAMAQLIKLRRDTVWAFILKNIYKPLFLCNQKFDVVIGNPPWISYRYVESTDYQDFLKKLILQDYQLLPSARAELITQLDLATLFFLRCSDLYMKKGGVIAFVMPRAVFVSDQHDAFRSGPSKPRARALSFPRLSTLKM